METKFDPGQMVAIDITAKVDKIVIENTYPKPGYTAGRKCRIV